METLADILNNYDPDQIWVCEKCGGPHVYKRAWVNINSSEFLDYVDPFDYEYWCEDCRDTTDSILMSEYDETKKKGGLNWQS